MRGYRYAGGELERFRDARNWKTYIRRNLHPHIAGKVLEVGAGIGTNTAFLLSDRVTRWDCLEPDPVLLARLSLRVRRLETPVPIRTLPGTLASLPPEARYDVILYVDVLEHIENDEAELAVAAQHLVPGGKLAVLAPAHGWLFSPFDRAVGHLRRYSIPRLRALTPAGMHSCSARYLDAMGMLASLGNRFLLKSSEPSPASLMVWDRVLVPCSVPLDRALGYRLGKSVMVIWASR